MPMETGFNYSTPRVSRAVTAARQGGRMQILPCGRLDD